MTTNRKRRLLARVAITGILAAVPVAAAIGTASADPAPVTVQADQNWQNWQNNPGDHHRDNNQHNNGNWNGNWNPPQVGFQPPSFVQPPVFIQPQVIPSDPLGFLSNLIPTGSG